MDPVFTKNQLTAKLTNYSIKMEKITSKKLEKPSSILGSAIVVLGRINHLIEENLSFLPKTGNQLFELKSEIETILNNFEVDKEYQQYHQSDLQEVLLQANQILADSEKEINEG